MAMTDQQYALEKVRKQHGETAFTEHHLNYKLVGFRRGVERIWTIGDTWAQAIDSLERKVQRG